MSLRAAVLGFSLALIITAGSCSDDSDPELRAGTDLPVRIVVLGSSTSGPALPPMTGPSTPSTTPATVFTSTTPHTRYSLVGSRNLASWRA